MVSMKSSPLHRVLSTLLGSLVTALVASCSGLISEPGSDRDGDGPGDPSPLVAVDQPRIWLLSNAQYERSVDALLGGGGEVADGFLVGIGGHGYSNHIERNIVGHGHAIQYQRAAQQLAETAVQPANIGSVWPCDDRYDDPDCAHDFITSFVGRAFRRPLLPEEVDEYTGVFQRALAAIDGPAGVQLVIETALQSPSFLYRTEVGPLDVPESEPVQLVELTAHEYASFVSYTLWGAPPDPAMVADAGDLSTVEGRRALVEAMLADPRLLDGLDDFVRGLTDLEHLSIASPAAGFEDGWDGLVESMEHEPRELMQHLFFGEGTATYESLVTSDVNFVDDRLAAVYGLPATGGTFEMVRLGEGRPGLLGQAGVLAAHSLPDGTSPPRRGKLVAQRFLCFGIPPPPDNIEVPPAPDGSPETTRQFFERATGPGTCGAACHVFLNPPGFAFEHFDQVGRFRTEDRGLPVDSTVDLAELELGSVEGAEDLGALLASSARAKACFAREVYRYSLGRSESSEDGPFVDELGDSFAAGGGDLRSLLVELLVSEAVFRRTTDP